MFYSAIVCVLRTYLCTIWNHINHMLNLQKPLSFFDKNRMQPSENILFVYQVNTTSCMHSFLNLYVELTNQINEMRSKLKTVTPLHLIVLYACWANMKTRNVNP